jgi:hypothetical protein
MKTHLCLFQNLRGAISQAKQRLGTSVKEQEEVPNLQQKAWWEYISGIEAAHAKEPSGEGEASKTVEGVEGSVLENSESINGTQGGHEPGLSILGRMNTVSPYLHLGYNISFCFYTASDCSGSILAFRLGRCRGRSTHDEGHYIGYTCQTPNCRSSTVDVLSAWKVRRQPGWGGYQHIADFGAGLYPPDCNSTTSAPTVVIDRIYARALSYALGWFRKRGIKTRGSRRQRVGWILDGDHSYRRCMGTV